MKRLVGLLGWIGVALVVAAVIVRFSRPDAPQISQGLALAGLVVTALYTATQWRDIGRSFSGRQVKYGSIAASGVLLVLGILVAVNWISSRQNKRWDLTVAGQFSLSDQTKQILSQLKTPLAIQAFYVDSSGDLRDGLTEYTYQSKQVSVEYIDANRNPTAAQQAGIQSVPTLLLKYDGRTERATSAEEQTLTNALKKVIEGKAKKIYFTQGHGEHDATGGDPDGYSGAAEAVKNDNFETASITLAQVGSVPADASLVVVAGPKNDFLAPELEALRAYLKQGGKLMLLIDPPDKGTAPEPTGLITLAHDWGVELGLNMVVDASGLGQLLGTNASVPIAMPVQHAITNNFRTMTAFPLARSASPVEGGVNGHTAQKFLETSPQSWAETDVKGIYATGRPEQTKDDKAGPVSVAAAVSAAVTEAAAGAAADAPKPETRVVVMGDSDFAANRTLGVAGNRELFLNISNWLAQQEDLIAIRPKNPADRPITMTADQTAYVFWFTMVIVPLLLFLNGLRVWWKKR